MSGKYKSIGPWLASVIALLMDRHGIFLQKSDRRPELRRLVSGPEHGQKNRLVHTEAPGRVLTHPYKNVWNLKRQDHSHGSAWAIVATQNRPKDRHMEITMNRKKMLVAMTAVALGIAGAVATAQAGNDKDDDARIGGIKVGPLGQRFGGPPTGGAFAFAPLTTRHGRVYRHHRYYYY